MSWLARMLGHVEPPVKRAIPAAVVADVWDLLIDDVRSKSKKPSTRELEDAYSGSDLVRSVTQEIIQAITATKVEASMGVRTLLEHPNVIQGWSAFVTQFFVAYLTTGFGSVLKVPVGSAATQELHVLKTSALNRQEGTFEKPFAHLSYADGRNHYPGLQLKDLITMISPAGGSATSPVSPLTSCWDVVQMDIARSRFQRAALLRLPFMVGVVETESTTSKPQRDQLQQSLKQILGGDTLVMPNGAHMTTPGLGRDSITLPGLGEQAEARVCAAFNVPPILVGVLAGLNRSTYANYGEARASFRQETITPILAQMSDAFSRGLGEEVIFTLPDAEAPESSATEQAQEDKVEAGVQ